MAYLVDGKTFYEKRPLGVDSLGHTDDELEDCFPAYGIQTLDDLMALKLEEEGSNPDFADFHPEARSQEWAKPNCETDRQNSTR